MAEPEQSDKNTSTPQRRSYQNRSFSACRGRSRANASVSKALHFFGVRDLREILDRKHQEQDESKTVPPPNPSYSYLKDPLRENANKYQTYRYQKEHYPERSSGEQQQRNYHFRGLRGRGRGIHRESRHSESEKAAFLQNPVNIKVELIASTGKRNCKIDEDTKLADIKHVPNHKLKDLRPPRSENRETNEKNTNERGRGRGGRSRGRGGRGRGRGQNRYPSNRSDKKQEDGHFVVQNAPEVVGEENWDNDPPAENIGSNEEEIVDKSHDEDPENQEFEHAQQFYVEADAEDYEEDAGDATVELEENLVVTSLVDEAKNKRTVTFKVDDEIETGKREKPQNKDENVAEEPLNKEDIEKVEASNDDK